MMPNLHYSDPIDRADRDRIANAIEGYLRCEIDNFQLDDILDTAKDRAAFEIAREVWFFYSDCKKHRNEKSHKMTEPSEALFARWIQFLRSDHEWPIREPDPRKKWYSGARWHGATTPIGCILGLLMLPWALFEVILLGFPKPRFNKNEYWPFQSREEWTALST